MRFDDFNIAELQHSDAIPDRYEMPGNKHILESTLGDVIAPALAVQTPQEADVELLMVVAMHLHAAGGVMSWRQAFVEARASIAWYAFACDISDGLYMAETDPATDHKTLIRRRENTAMRDIAYERYGAQLNLVDAPESREPAKRMKAIAQRIAGKKPRVVAEQGGLF